MHSHHQGTPLPCTFLFISTVKLVLESPIQGVFNRALSGIKDHVNSSLFPIKEVIIHCGSTTSILQLLLLWHFTTTIWCLWKQLPFYNYLTFYYNFYIKLELHTCSFFNSILDLISLFIGRIHDLWAITHLHSIFGDMDTWCQPLPNLLGHVHQHRKLLFFQFLVL